MAAPPDTAQTPLDHIVYISAHDNETLFDAIQYKAPLAATVAERVRMQDMGLSMVASEPGRAVLPRGQRHAALQVDGSGQL